MQRIFFALVALIFAFGILATSVFRTANPSYNFSRVVNFNSNKGSVPIVEYYFPYTGIGPSNVLWPLKAFRDKVWLSVTSDPVKRADLLLLFADKRLGMAKDLVKTGNYSLAISTVTKAEKYLEEALKEQDRAAQTGIDMTGFLQKITLASLKHTEILEEMMNDMPEDARPILNQTMDYSRRVLKKSTQDLQKTGRLVPF